MTFTFYPNIPNAPNDPEDDQPLMLQNNVATNGIIAVDHVGFNAGNGGYHTIIHQGPNTRTRSGVGAVTANFPAAIPGIGQVFTALYTPDTTVTSTDTELFSLTGLNDLSQITGFVTKGADGQDGYQWIGGALIQWGTVAFAGASAHEIGTVIFKDRLNKLIPFPNNIYMVNATLQVAASSETVSSNTIAIRDFTNLQFRWVFNSSSSTGSTRYPGFYWIAIGA